MKAHCLASKIGTSSFANKMTVVYAGMAHTSAPLYQGHFNTLRAAFRRVRILRSSNQSWSALRASIQALEAQYFAGGIAAHAALRFTALQPTPGDIAASVPRRSRALPGKTIDSTKANKSIAQRLVAVFNDRQLDLLEEVLHP